MKKISLLLSVLGLTACLSACHHDSNSYCDAGFTDGCEEGMYVYCHYEKEDSRGVVKAEAEIEFNSIVYTCNDNDVLVPKDYTCTGGVLNKAGVPVDNNAVCSNDLILTSCDGDEFITGKEVCLNNSIIGCEMDANGHAVTYKDNCASGLTCENYERNDKNYAGCFDPKDVSKGCADGITILGACDASSGLTFCTHKNPAKGQTIRLDCAARGQGCMLINEEYGFDCSATCKDSNDQLYNEHGTCSDDNKQLYYCLNKNGTYTLDVLDCAGDSKTCGFDDFQYDCL